MWGRGMGRGSTALRLNEGLMGMEAAGSWASDLNCTLLPEIGSGGDPRGMEPLLPNEAGPGVWQEQLGQL
jgi:hypothetical protein